LDPGSEIRDPGWVKIRILPGSGIRDKHPGSATLGKRRVYFDEKLYGTVKTPNYDEDIFLFLSI
jgi:hypothetical protein